MSINVSADWWKHIFDEIYLQTDARSVCNETLTRHEVNFLEYYLKLHKNDFILDLCGGQGRHALELARKGFQNVTVLDYSHYLLQLGIKTARNENFHTNFVRGDAREVCFPANTFHYVLIMASSFGYFVDDGENRKIINEVFRLLKSGGTILLDLPNHDFVLKNFKKESAHRVDEDLSVTRRREIKGDVIYSEESVHSKKNGCISIKSYCMRLFSADKIKHLFNINQFSQVKIKKDFMSRAEQGDFGSMTNRVIVTARKQ
jgi:D-alanine-D-alanine ligase